MATRNRAETSPGTAADRAIEREALVAQLRLVATQLETARCLEHRAERTTSQALAAVLRERAGERRRRAQRLQAGLTMLEAARRPLPLCR